MLNEMDFANEFEALAEQSWQITQGRFRSHVFWREVRSIEQRVVKLFRSRYSAGMTGFSYKPRSLARIRFMLATDPSIFGEWTPAALGEVSTTPDQCARINAMTCRALARMAELRGPPVNRTTEVQPAPLSEQAAPSESTGKTMPASLPQSPVAQIDSERSPPGPLKRGTASSPNSKIVGRLGKEEVAILQFLGRFPQRRFPIQELAVAGLGFTDRKTAAKWAGRLAERGIVAYVPKDKQGVSITEAGQACLETMGACST